MLSMRFINSLWQIKKPSSYAVDEKEYQAQDWIEWLNSSGGWKLNRKRSVIPKSEPEMGKPGTWHMRCGYPRCPWRFWLWRLLLRLWVCRTESSLSSIETLPRPLSNKAIAILSRSCIHCFSWLLGLWPKLSHNMIIWDHARPKEKGKTLYTKRAAKISQHVPAGTVTVLSEWVDSKGAWLKCYQRN